MTTDGMHVRLLDDVRVVRDGEEFDPGGPVRSTVLAVLASAAPDPVSHNRLVDAVWPKNPPESARNSLQAHVSKLRRLLEPARDAGDPSLIKSVGDGYRLDIDEVATDIGRFRDLVSGAVTAADWREAVELGRGKPFAGCVESWPVEAERRTFEEQHLEAVASWLEAELAEGNPEEVIGELERLVREHPLRERFWALLVQALAAAGRRPEALEVFQRARRILLADAGIEPGAELQAAQRAVLTSDRATPSHITGTSPVRRVPAPRTPLVGRDAEVREVTDLLGQWRLVTVVGPGGVGKTRLASEVASRPLDRVEQAAFVDLTSVRDEEEVVPAVAGAGGVRLVGGRDGLEAALVERLRATPTLLVVDNAEHVIGAVAGLIDLLLDEVETLVVLATSRRPLDVGGERLFQLAPMDPEAAVSLFLDRAGARRPGITETVERDIIRELCQQLDRLPLAIEIAAGQTTHLSVDEILATTAKRPHALRRPASDTDDDRHYSLRSTIVWSYELLPTQTQAVLRHLAVFDGPFDRDQAAAVLPGATTNADVSDVLGDLVAHSLVVADPDPAGTTYRLLETIRAFAGAELQRHDEVVPAKRRHREWYVHWARRVPTGSTALDTGRALPLERHHQDLVAALTHAHRTGDDIALADLAVLASGLGFCPGGLPDAARWVTLALERSDAIPSANRADLLAVGMLVAMLDDDVATVQERFRAALPLAEEHPGGVVPFVLALGIIVPHTAREALAASEQLFARHGDEMNDEIRHAINAVQPLITAVETGDPEAALTEAETAWAGRRWSDRETLASWAIHAALLHVTGRHRDLQDRLDAMQRLPPALGHPTPFATIFESLALAGQGDRAAAIDHLRRSHWMHWRGIPGIESDLVSAVAVIHHLTGEPDRARELLDRPGFRARHPGTTIVHVDCATRLGLPVDDYVSNWVRGRPEPRLSDLLEEILAP